MNHRGDVIIILLLIVGLIIGGGVYLLRDKIFNTSPAVANVTPTPEVSVFPATCGLYALREIGDDNLQLITIDLTSRNITAIGDIHNTVDLGAIAVNPQTKVLYTNLKQNNELYKIDARTGKLVDIGHGSHAQADTLTFNPSDKKLYSWIEDIGLVVIDHTTGADQIVYSSLLDVDTMTWSNDGRLLYLVINGEELYQFDLNTQQLVKIADNLLPETEEITGLYNDTLIASTEDDVQQTVTLYTYDLVNKAVKDTLPLNEPGLDIEGLTIDPGCVLRQ